MILDIRKETVKNKKHINEYSFAALFKAYKKEPNKEAVKKINMIPDNVNICKVYSDGQYVYANSTFYAGDIVEICPTMEISKSALYDIDVRKIVFEVKQNEQYVIPFGYCQYYDLCTDTILPNCTYIWDPNMKVIVIKASMKIEKGTKLVLNIQK